MLGQQVSYIVVVEQTVIVVLLKAPKVTALLSECILLYVLFNVYLTQLLFKLTAIL